MKQVDVLVFTNNHNRLLNKTIYSIKRQTFKDFNIMLFNNYRNNNIDKNLIKNVDCYYHCPKIKGPSALRNFGLSKSKSKYISIIDGDDYWHRDKLKYQLSIAKIYKETVIYTRIINEYDQKKIIDKSKLNSGNLYKNLILNEISITGSMSGVMFTNNMIQKLEKKYNYIFDERLNYCEDFDFFIRLSTMYNFFAIDKALVVVTNNQNSHQSKFDNYERSKIKYKMLSNNLNNNIGNFTIIEIIKFNLKAKIKLIIKYTLKIIF